MHERAGTLKAWPQEARDKGNWMGTLAVGLVLALAGPARGAEMSGDLFVAADGRDTNAGTKEKPFATLERARDAVRELKKQGLPKGGATVWLCGGTYERTRAFELGQEDSGTAEAPVVYRALPNEAVRLIGGHEVKTFKPVVDPDIRKRLAPAAKDKVLQANLKAEGVTEFGALDRRGMGVPIRPMWAELFFQDKPMQVARWPNQGWTSIEKAEGPSGEYNYGAKGPGKFIYSGDRPKRWATFDDILVHGCWTWAWADSYERVKAIDVAKRELATEPPHGVYGYRTGGRFYFLNILEELDEPGEWYLDRKTGILYFWPPAPLEQTKTMISTLGEPFVLFENVRHVTLRGLTMECSRGSGVVIVGGSDNLVAGCTIRNLGTAAVSIGEYLQERPTQARKDTLWNANGGVRNGVQGCDIHRMGEGGILLGGGDRKTLTPAGNFAVNNHIFEFSRVGRTYKYAVYIDGVGNRIAHNRIHDAPHEAIGFAGNDHIIEFNDISRVCLETDDAGAIHQGRDWTWRGFVMRYNYIHDLGGGHTYGIYLDDMMCGALIFGNVFCNAGGGGAVFIHGGRDNTVENNIFVNCRAAVFIHRFGFNEYFDGRDNTLFDRLKAVNPKQPPYATRYPELTNILEDQPREPKGNAVVRNVCINSVLDMQVAAKIRTQDNLSVSDKKDPLFVDLMARNVQFKDDSPVYKAVPGFHKIPFEKIGLCRDEYRP